ncbi:hypothetical protein [Sinorhizobium medicae]|uniref:hypothetical protein n=1 Tax=Sinorhizobium medicae TaxID=110321 RepID=UPI002B1BE4B2|nr:hypothetical protein [Sinorhizobium medicae]WQO45901.1 hypothetical protein U8C42_02425 [Sinorhizobium medicae]
MKQCKRIEAARAALARAAWVRGQAPAYGEDAVIDLIADLRLWCDSAGLDFGRCDELAFSFYCGEEEHAKIVECY